MSIITEIRCGCCGASTKLRPGERVYQVRAELKAAGWRVGMRGGYDLCRSCYEDCEAYLHRRSKR